LQYVSELDFSGRNVLDVGCGTGIIGIACLKSNAKKVIFVDNDLSALNVTRENFQKNRCGDSHFLYSSISKVPEKSDYIFANILLNPLKKMSKTILKKLKKGGRVYLSGILIGQVSELLASYTNASDGMIVKVSEKKLKQWICVELSFK
jgi:ribosomal protein L11 methyltransferase